MRSSTLLATAALLFALPALAQEKLQPAPAPRPAPTETVTKTFSVADLVTPVAPKSDSAALQKNVEALVKVVTGTVRPYTWDANGGTGSVEFFDLGCTLVVKNTPAAVADVCELLESLRRKLGPCISYEVRAIKVPVGFCRDWGTDRVITEEKLGALLEAVQSHRDASVMQFPKLTTFDGQTATVRTGEDRAFVTGLDVVKVNGATVFVPKNTSVYLGDTLTIGGTASADEKSVTLRAHLTRTALVGDVELVPVVTQITPVFEGGSQGKPVPFTQYVQAPTVKTEKVEKAVVVPTNGTVVLGSWKEPGEPKRAKNGPRLLPVKEKAAPEYEVVVLATVRAFRTDESAPVTATKSVAYALRNVAAADAAQAVAAYLQVKNLTARLTFDAPTNSVFYSAEAVVQKQIHDILVALDKAPTQVVVQAMIVEVPHKFIAKCGLDGDRGSVASGAWTLTPREVRMFNELLRTEKERGGIDVLSRPQMSVADNQTGFVQVGQSVPVETPGGKVEVVQVGMTLRVTPRVAPDGKSVQLRSETQITSLGGTVDLGSGVVSPVFNSQELQSTTKVAFGETLVLGCGTRRHPDHSLTGAVRYLLGDEYHRTTLLILTPHLVQPVTPGVVPAGWFTK